MKACFFHLVLMAKINAALASAPTIDQRESTVANAKGELHFQTTTSDDAKYLIEP